jgi:hypothetical protein
MLGLRPMAPANFDTLSSTTIEGAKYRAPLTYLYRVKDFNTIAGSEKDFDTTIKILIPSLRQ